MAPSAALQQRGGPPVRMLAKKKGGGGKKGGKQKKDSGFAWASNFELKPFESSELRALAETVVNAYQTRTGKPLDASLVGANDLPKKLWSLPVAVLVATAGVAATEADAEAAIEGEEASEQAGAVSVCKYVNLAALEAYGLTGDDYSKLIGQPTELPPASGEKYQSGYAKKLKGGAEAFTFEGSRWVLEKAAVVDGKLAMESLGVAYAFEEWQIADGTICSPGGARRAPALLPEEVQGAVDAQGLEVRRLKDEGLGNKDPQVAAAVAELLRLKALLPPEESA